MIFLKVGDLKMFFWFEVIVLSFDLFGVLFMLIENIVVFLFLIFWEVVVRECE